MDVHCEIVGPDVTLADRGGVEDGNRDEQQNEPEIAGCHG